MNGYEGLRPETQSGASDYSPDATWGAGRPTAARPGFLAGLREGAWPEGIFGHGGSDLRAPEAATLIGSGAPAGAGDSPSGPALAAALPPLVRLDDPWLTQSSPAAETGALVEVDVFCDGFRISGWIDTGQFERLSDWINMKSGFIGVLRENPAAADAPAGESGQAGGTRWVRLSGVVLVAEHEGAMLEQGWRPVPVVQKEKVRVSMVTPGYRLDGDLHVHADGSLCEYLSVPEPRFLPVTDVTVLSRSDATQAARFRFALVSREHLVLVSDER
jgi:hypothetical protein